MRNVGEDVARWTLGARGEKWSVFLVPGILAAFVTVTFLFGLLFLSPENQADIEVSIAEWRDSVWAPVAVLVIFTVVGFTGFPQFLLMAAAVVVFGPTVGFIYAWLATVFSAAMGFLVGRRMGADLLLRYGGRRANSLSAWLGRHGILASALMRILPTGPFVMVNLVAGVSRITFTQFLIGSTLGTIPKAGLMAYLGASLFEFLSSRDPRDLLLLALGVAVWFAVMAVVRRLMARRIGTPEPPSEMESRGTGREHAADPAAALEDAQRRGAADPSRRD